MKLLRAAIAGMAILAMPSLGYAADLPRAAPAAYVPAMVPVYNWTGFYLGGNIGYAWRNTEITGIFGANLGDLSNDRFMFGGQMGYNWQVNQFVLGVEWDFDWADGEKATPFVTTATGLVVQGRVDSSWVTTLAARFGYAADRWLFYTKLGACLFAVPCAWCPRNERQV